MNLSSRSNFRFSLEFPQFNLFMIQVSIVRLKLPVCSSKLMINISDPSCKSIHRACSSSAYLGHESHIHKLWTIMIQFIFSRLNQSLCRNINRQWLMHSLCCILNILYILSVMIRCFIEDELNKQLRIQTIEWYGTFKWNIYDIPRSSKGVAIR